MIETFLQKGLRNPLCFDTLKELEEYVDSTLNVDDVVTLLGVVAVGDGLGHQRIIKEADDGTGVILANGKYANVIPNSRLSDKANKAVQVVAGLGIKGGGTLGDSSINLQIDSANEGIVVNSDSIELNTVHNLKDSSSVKPLSAGMGKVLDESKINITDIVNDFTTGGVNKVPSAELVKSLKQIIDAMGEGGVAKLAYQLKSAERSRVPSYGTLPAGGTTIVASSGIIVDPRVFINGELMNPDEYDIDINAAIITLKVPLKYPGIFFVDDSYAPRYKFSVSTVNFLVNAPSLKSKLALGDVIDIQGGSDANDGGHHTRIVENISKLNGVDLGGGLYLNEVPNSRISEKLDVGGFWKGTALDLSYKKYPPIIEPGTNIEAYATSNVLDGTTVVVTGHSIKPLSSGQWGIFKIIRTNSDHIKITVDAVSDQKRLQKTIRGGNSPEGWVDMYTPPMQYIGFIGAYKNARLISIPKSVSHLCIMSSMGPLIDGEPPIYGNTPATPRNLYPVFVSYKGPVLSKTIHIWSVNYTVDGTSRAISLNNVGCELKLEFNNEDENFRHFTLRSTGTDVGSMDNYISITGIYGG